MSTHLGRKFFFANGIYHNGSDTLPRDINLFVDFFIPREVLLIMGIRKFPVDMMHHGVALRIRFKLKRFSTEPVAFHLVGEETLGFLDECINFCVYVGADRLVAGPEVDEGHEPWTRQ